jgi:ketosteroid isomerase-like protein
MSQRNAEIVRRAFAAAIRRPKPDFATINDLFHPDHVLISRIGGHHRGARGYRDWLLYSEEALPWESRLDKVTEIDDDRVLAILPTRIRSASSGVVLDQLLASIATVRAGKIIHTEVFLSPEEALEAVGLND